MISIELSAPHLTMADEFDALARRAAPNVFMHPAALCAAADTGFADIHVLRARESGGRLVGFWALRTRRIAPLWPAMLVAPPYEYAFVSNPVIEADCLDAVIPAFFDAIARDASLPKVIQLKLIDGDGETGAPMMAALAARRAQMLQLSAHTRPFMGSEAERKRSGSTAKKLRQDFSRLGALGAVDIVNDRRASDVRAAFESFLQLELRSWKGANGTALLSSEEDADFARALISNLAVRESASVALLRVDGRAIATQVLLYCGTMAYTWKTAFDADYAKYSPGTLLVDKVTDALIAAGVTQIESCSSEDSFLNHLWTGRRATVELLADVGDGKSMNFALAAGAARGREWLRQARGRLRAWHWLPGKRKSLAVTRG